MKYFCRQNISLQMEITSYGVRSMQYEVHSAQ
jgi:hypothetical protein